jgi:predicted ArsR family transcriptional regulator
MARVNRRELKTNLLHMPVLNCTQRQAYREWQQAGILALLVDRSEPLDITEIAAALHQPAEAVQRYCDLLWTDGLVESTDDLAEVSPDAGPVRYFITGNGQAAALAYFENCVSTYSSAPVEYN